MVAVVGRSEVAEVGVAVGMVAAVAAEVMVAVVVATECGVRWKMEERPYCSVALSTLVSSGGIWVI